MILFRHAKSASHPRSRWRAADENASALLCVRAPALRRCSASRTKIAERYCRPTSAPWRSTCVGSCSVQKTSNSASKSSFVLSKASAQASACPVSPRHHLAVGGRIRRAARVADLACNNAFHAPQARLDPPKAARRQDSTLPRTGRRAIGKIARTLTRKITRTETRTFARLKKYHRFVSPSCVSPLA